MRKKKSVRAERSGGSVFAQPDLPSPKRELLKLTHKEIVEGMRMLRKRVKPNGKSIREMVEEGRRF